MPSSSILAGGVLSIPLHVYGTIEHFLAFLTYNNDKRNYDKTYIYIIWPKNKNILC